MQVTQVLAGLIASRCMVLSNTCLNIAGSNHRIYADGTMIALAVVAAGGDDDYKLTDN